MLYLPKPINTLFITSIICVSFCACAKKNTPSSSNTSNVNTTTAATITSEQIPNSNFDAWYEVKKEDGTKEHYFEPGNSATEAKVWATRNKSAAVIIVNGGDVTPDNVPTTRVSNGSKFAAQLTTKEIEPGKAVGNGIITGGIFTGTVNNASPQNPHPELGFSFTKQPKSFSFKYKYEPKTPVKNGDGQEVANSTDGMDAYVILEHRNNGSIKRLGVLV